MQRKVEKPPYLPESTGLTSLTILAPRVRFALTLVETVDLHDAHKLLDAAEKAANVEVKEQRLVRWVRIPKINLSALPSREDSFGRTADMLGWLADIPSVSGHERDGP